MALKKAGKFSLQTDESMDIVISAQVMVVVKYRGEYDIQEEFLFCNALTTTTTGEELFLKKHNLNWLNCLAVCTDGAPSMIGCCQAPLPFYNNNISEQRFSSFVTIKTRARNHLDPQHDLPCTLAINIKPNFELSQNEAVPW